MPKDAAWLLDHIVAVPEVSQGLTRVLADVVLVKDFATARHLVKEDPRLRAVTPDGVMVGEGWVSAGTGSQSTQYVASICSLLRSVTYCSHCPGIELHSSLSDLYDVPSLLQPVDVAITNDELNEDSVMKDPGSWEMKLWQRIDEELPVASRHYPVRIRLMNSTSYSPRLRRRRGDGPRNRIPRPRALRPASRGLRALSLSQRFNLDMDPRSAPDRDSFIGVHLRIEKDAEKLKFPSYGTQAAAALE